MVHMQTSRSAFRKFAEISAAVLIVIVTILGIAKAVQPYLTTSVGGAKQPISQSSATPEATATATLIATPNTNSNQLPALTVAGNHLTNTQGQTVTLIGASHSSLEYSCTGDGHMSIADFQLMRSWGMNAVRLPVSSEFWADSGNDCPQYHQTVEQTISNAESAGLYVILDLQWNAPFDTPYDRQHGGEQCPLPDTGKDTQFWRDIAALYKNNTGVLFDIFGEPHDISWSQWYNGGSITNLCMLIGGSSNGQVVPGTYTAVGMQAMTNTIRAIAPNNIIVAAGINWGYDLSGLGEGYALNGGNIIYDTHPFNYGGKQPSNWTNDFGRFTGTYVIIAGEFGSYDCGTSYISAAITYFNAHHMSWLAWAWNNYGCGGPALLSNWNGTPSQPYGAYIKTQMLQVTTPHT